LPWAVAFPEGLPPTVVPVHPTQLYEAIALAALAWFLIRWRRADVDDAVVLGRYLVLAGSTRFAIEFISVNARLFGPFTLAQLIMSKARQRFADGTSADWVGVEGDRRPALVTKLIADR
jgi:prolipoprotein diacylglyceryltransferase